MISKQIYGWLFAMDNRENDGLKNVLYHVSVFRVMTFCPNCDSHPTVAGAKNTAK